MENLREILAEVSRLGSETSNPEVAILAKAIVGLSRQVEDNNRIAVRHENVLVGTGALPSLGEQWSDVTDEAD